MRREGGGAAVSCLFLKRTNAERNHVETPKTQEAPRLLSVSVCVKSTRDDGCKLCSAPLLYPACNSNHTKPLRPATKRLLQSSLRKASGVASAPKLRHDSEEQGDEMGHPRASGGSSHAPSGVPADHRPHKREGSANYYAPWERECPHRGCCLGVFCAGWGVVVFVV